jgi:beta-1,4-mannosyl-glycoprotein beta-1,4-N-acetylglucosaminyltransferase
MKIYDCFTFFNELEVLEIRLNILNDYVDYFVIVEATKTHAGKPKELYYLKNKNKFKKFENKIIHVIVDDMPEIKESRWELENFQRNAIIRGLKNCEPDDIILISDVDEIPNPKKFKQMKEILTKRKRYNKNLIYFTKNIYIKLKNVKYISRYITFPLKMILSHPIVVFENKLFYYYLNGFVKDNWAGTASLLYSDLVDVYERQPQLVRDIRNRYSLNMLRNSGWHFSFLGDSERIKFKLNSFAHSEYDKPEINDPKLIEKRIKEGKNILGKKENIRYIKISNDYPDYLLNNLEKYKELIM